MAKSIIPGDTPDKCYICKRSRPTNVHHCLHGTRRALADKYGLTVHLCTHCHILLHDRGLHDTELEADAQKAFEAAYVHDEYMRIFGKNYI